VHLRCYTAYIHITIFYDNIRGKRNVGSGTMQAGSSRRCVIAGGEIASRTGVTSSSDKDARALCDLYDNIIIIMLWSVNDRQVTRVMCIYTTLAISVLYCVCEWNWVFGGRRVWEETALGGTVGAARVLILCQSCRVRI